MTDLLDSLYFEDGFSIRLNDDTNDMFVLIDYGSRIYPMDMADDNLIGVAFRTEDDKWTYMVVNNSDEEKKVSFLNNTLFPAEMRRYTFDTAAVPTDNKVLESDGSVTANGRVLTDTLKPQSFIVYTDIAEK